jgi:ribosomal protein S27AE
MSARSKTGGGVGTNQHAVKGRSVAGDPAGAGRAAATLAMLDTANGDSDEMVSYSPACPECGAGVDPGTEPGDEYAPDPCDDCAGDSDDGDMEVSHTSCTNCGGWFPADDLHEDGTCDDCWNADADELYGEVSWEEMVDLAGFDPTPENLRANFAEGLDDDDPKTVLARLVPDTALEAAAASIVGPLQEFTHRSDGWYQQLDESVGDTMRSAWATAGFDPHDPHLGLGPTQFQAVVDGELTDLAQFDPQVKAVDDLRDDARDAPGSRYGTRPEHWVPVAVAYADLLAEHGYDYTEALDAAARAVVNDDPAVADSIRDARPDLYDTDWD